MLSLWVQSPRSWAESHDREATLIRVLTSRYHDTAALFHQKLWGLFSSTCSVCFVLYTQLEKTLPKTQRRLGFNVEIITVNNVIIKINKLSVCHALLVTLSGHCHTFIQDSASRCQEAGQAPRIQAWGWDFGSQNSPERWAGTEACWESHHSEGGDMESPWSKPASYTNQRASPRFKTETRPR